MEPKQILVLVGPTAVGKSSLAMRLAPELNAEIVSADSMQVYRGMDIGTGKPWAEERRGVPHHLIDVADPDEAFHAARYQELADRAIEDIRARGKFPFVVGGSGLYVKVLLHGLFQDPTPARFQKWGEKVQYYRSLGEDPYKILKEIDPKAARNIHPHDLARSERALEVLARTGKSITVFQEQHGFQQQRYQALVLGLTTDRRGLFDRIEARVDEMVRRGFLDEVRSLRERGYGPELASMRALGYRHMTKVLEGEWDLDEAARLLKRDTRRYARRQYTWFHHQEKVSWLTAPCPPDGILKTIRAHFGGM